MQGGKSPRVGQDIDVDDEPVCEGGGKYRRRRRVVERTVTVDQTFERSPGSAGEVHQGRGEGVDGEVDLAGRHDECRREPNRRTVGVFRQHAVA